MQQEQWEATGGFSIQEQVLRTCHKMLSSFEAAMICTIDASWVIKMSPWWVLILTPHVLCDLEKLLHSVFLHFGFILASSGTFKNTNACSHLPHLLNSSPSSSIKTTSGFSNLRFIDCYAIFLFPYLWKWADNYSTEPWRFCESVTWDGIWNDLAQTRACSKNEMYIRMLISSCTHLFQVADPWEQLSSFSSQTGTSSCNAPFH